MVSSETPLTSSKSRDWRHIIGSKHEFALTEIAMSGHVVCGTSLAPSPSQLRYCEGGEVEVIIIFITIIIFEADRLPTVSATAACGAHGYGQWQRSKIRGGVQTLSCFPRVIGPWMLNQKDTQRYINNRGEILMIKIGAEERYLN